MSVQFTDNSGAVKNQLAANVRRALTAMGAAAVEMIQDEMLDGFDTPIYDTGATVLSASYLVDESDGKTVDVGVMTEYAPYVHEGTYKMQGRPFMRVLVREGSVLRQEAEAHLKDGSQA